ncbi:MAG: hypothetical protein ACTSQO_15130 [Candidatus Helarchaeota archaeon]
MFVIIEKGRRWVQMQIDDYFGKIKVKFIDLHNKRGRDQFTQIFVRKFRAVKIRKKKRGLGPAKKIRRFWRESYEKKENIRFKSL